MRRDEILLSLRSVNFIPQLKYCIVSDHHQCDITRACIPCSMFNIPTTNIYKRQIVANNSLMFSFFSSSLFLFFFSSFAYLACTSSLPSHTRCFCFQHHQFSTVELSLAKPTFRESLSSPISFPRKWCI